LCLICAREGNLNALSDAGTGGSMALACAEGAYYNVRINVNSLPPPPPGGETELEEYRTLIAAEADGLLQRTLELVQELRQIIQAGLGS
jgi:formiminotetrahydrofolate cyclodeaminase